VSAARIRFANGLRKVARDFRGFGVVEEEGEIDGAELARDVPAVDPSS